MATAEPVPSVRSGLLGRQLGHYPATPSRTLYLGIVVLATITLYYELYIQGSVATQIITDLHMTLTYFIAVSMVGNAVGALGSLAAGLADRWGRANLVVYGLLGTALLILVGLPAAGSKGAYLVLFALVSVVEGVILVATPALIRDFSPQLGRASAMGFWTLGPVMGSLVATEVSSHTLDAHPDWQYQFRVCGVVGVVIFLLAFAGLRELSAQLRDQLMVSIRDRELIEARAADIDPDRALHGQWRQMLKPDVIGPAFAISVFLLFYYIAAGFFVVYFATNFGYSSARANALANWYWIANAIALVVVGAVSDRLKVRKPFMIAGAVLSLVGVAVFAQHATEASTGYYSFVRMILLISIGGGITFAAWMAAFTETVEKHNPAATATGLAVWGGIIRSVVTVALLALIVAISAASTLVDQGSRAQQIRARYPAEVATLQKVPAAASAALATDPGNLAAQAAAVAAIAGNGIAASDVGQAQALATQYQKQLATLDKLSPTTRAALAQNPTDATVQVQAVSEIAGVPVRDVTRTQSLATQYAQEIVTAKALDPATATALLLNPTDPALSAKAAREIVAALRVTPAAAAARLRALAHVPLVDLQFLNTTGTKVQAAADELKAVAAIPAADLSFLQTKGAAIKAAGAALQEAAATIPKQDQAFLQANAAKIARAQVDSPKQWQRWWWICFAGQVVFIPFVFLMTGRWNPAAAARDARAHDAAVAAELARMHASRAPA